MCIVCCHYSVVIVLTCRVFYIPRVFCLHLLIHFTIIPIKFWYFLTKIKKRLTNPGHGFGMDVSLGQKFVAQLISLDKDHYFFKTNISIIINIIIDFS